MVNYRPPEFVDIHCHLLPGLDDGPAGISDAVAMAEMAAADGIRTIVATPHQLGNFDNRAAEIRAAVAVLQQELNQRQVPLRILPGADVRVEPELLRKIRNGDVLTIADRGRYVLLELPHEVYLPLERVLDELGMVGMIGVLSHPERNKGILSRPDVLRPLVQRGCLLQLTAGSLTGTFGRQVQSFAEYLLTEGLIHVVASDAHGIRSRPPVLSLAYQRLVQLAGRTTAIRLCSLNPIAIITGNRVHAENREPAKSAWSAWFRRTLASEYPAA